MRWGILSVKKRKIWVWRAVDCSRNRTIGWCFWDSSTKTFIEFYKKFEHLDAKFYSDDKEVIPEENLKNIRLELNKTTQIYDIFRAIYKTDNQMKWF